MVIVIGTRPGPSSASAVDRGAGAHPARGSRRGRDEAARGRLRRNRHRPFRRQHLHERTAGNPLFITGDGEGAARGSLRLGRAAGRLALGDGDVGKGMPMTLRALLGARIDALSEEARTVLRVASVIGIMFRERSSPTSSASAVERDLYERLAEASLIVAVDRVGGWRFSHPLIHDAAYCRPAWQQPPAAARACCRPARRAHRPRCDRRDRSPSRCCRRRGASRADARRGRGGGARGRGAGRGGVVLDRRGGSDRGRVASRPTVSALGRRSRRCRGVCRTVGLRHRPSLRARPGPASKTIADEPGTPATARGQAGAPPRSPRDSGGDSGQARSGRRPPARPCRAPRRPSGAPGRVVLAGRQHRRFDDEQVGAAGRLDERLVGPGIARRSRPGGRPRSPDRAAPGGDVVPPREELDREVADGNGHLRVVLHDVEGLVEEADTLADRCGQLLHSLAAARREQDRDPPGRRSRPTATGSAARRDRCSGRRGGGRRGSRRARAGRGSA